MYHFGGPSLVHPTPTSQTEAIGDDAMRASEYGIANLKRILPNLIDVDLPGAARTTRN